MLGQLGLFCMPNHFPQLYLLTATFFSTLFNSKGLEYDDVSSVHREKLRNTSRLIRRSRV
jgi:hypothetical protein